MRLRSILRVMWMEVGQLNLVSLIILVGSVTLMFYPLITRGFLSMGSRIELEALVGMVVTHGTGDDVVETLNRLAYLERKLYMLVGNRLFSLTYLAGPSQIASTEPLFLILGVVAYVSMEASSMLRPSVFKRYMTLPITREEYFIGRILFNVVVVSVFVVSTYFIIGSIFYRPDLSLLQASILALPELLLMSSIAFSVALFVRRDLPAFILSGGGVYIVFTQLILYLNRWLSRGGGSIDAQPAASPLNGYIVLIGIADELEKEDLLGVMMRAPFGIPERIDIPASLMALSVYIGVVIGLSLLIILLSAYFLRGVEVD